jgi:hypothetical protein
MRRANNLAMLAKPIPVWPERFSSLLFIFSCGLFVIPANDSIWINAMRIGVISRIITLHWFVTGKLPEKVEMLSDIIKNSQ